jgi:hypothetical protein
MKNKSNTFPCLSNANTISYNLYFKSISQSNNVLKILNTDFIFFLQLNLQRIFYIFYFI